MEINYQNEFEELSCKDLPWSNFENAHILLTGSTGMIGQYIAGFLLYLNRKFKLNIRISVFCRNMQKTEDLFKRRHYEESGIIFISGDLTEHFLLPKDKYDYVIHCGGFNHPAAFAKQPVETLKASAVGTISLLDKMVQTGTKGFVLLSTGEIYGEQMETHEMGCDESVAGIVETMRPRSCYPEGKRFAEALVSAYASEYGVRAMAARLGYVYGPTMMQSSSKADVQFFTAAKSGKNIVLKSDGRKLRSYMYVQDAVYGILTVLLKGNAGEAYNVANTKSTCTIAELAQEIAHQGNVRVVFDIPKDSSNDTDLKGGSAMNREILRTEKLENLGFAPAVEITEGVKRTLELMDKE